MTQVYPTFRRLRLAGWRQFASVDIEFHPRLTVLTGVNGAGKSTLLNILSRHLGVERPYLSTVKKGKDGKVSFISGLYDFPKRFLGWSGWSRRSDQHFGELVYSDDSKAALTVPQNQGLSYTVQVENQKNVMGLHIPSHRLLPMHQSIPHIAFTGVDPDYAFQSLVNESYTRWVGGYTGSSLIFQLKTMLAAWATVGEGNSTITADPRQREAYEGFLTILKKIIPPEIGFLRVSIQPPEVMLITRSGEFLIDAASGGLATLIEIAALIYTCSIRPEIGGGKFVVTFDEPENHLHPSLQRSLLPSLVEAFPNVQFIVATHSPFIVSALKESNVYVLTHSHPELSEMFDQTLERRIESVRLDYANRAGTASEILRDVLGVPITLPVWVEKELSLIVEKYRALPINEVELSRLRDDLRRAGLDELFPEALTSLGRNR